MKKIIKFIVKCFTDEIKVFPEHYQPECMDCNDGTCKGCKYYEGI